jgi:N-acetylglutamate synthase-like GNAT family acetyltransferase
VSPVRVRLAEADDIGWYEGEDRTIPPEAARRKVEAQEVFIVELAGRRAGHLRLDFLWSKFPFIALIRVLPELRRQGLGRVLLEFTEGRLRDAGHDTLYSSSQVNEPGAQAWHRRQGFEECGTLVGVNPGGIGEMFFRKRLR